MRLISDDIRADLRLKGAKVLKSETGLQSCSTIGISKGDIANPRALSRSSRL